MTTRDTDPTGALYVPTVDGQQMRLVQTGKFVEVNVYGSSGEFQVMFRLDHEGAAQLAAGVLRRTPERGVIPDTQQTEEETHD